MLVMPFEGCVDDSLEICVARKLCSCVLSPWVPSCCVEDCVRGGGRACAVASRAAAAVLVFTSRGAPYRLMFFA